MSLVPSLLQAIVNVDGEAMVMHAGDKPYVVSPTGQVELASRGLTLQAVNGIVGQLLPPEIQNALDEFGAIRYELPPLPVFPGEHFTVVAARGGDDVWVEIRRHRVAVDDRVPEEFFPQPPPVAAAPAVERSLAAVPSAPAAAAVSPHAAAVAPVSPPAPPLSVAAAGAPIKHVDHMPAAATADRAAGREIRPLTEQIAAHTAEPAGVDGDLTLPDEVQLFGVPVSDDFGEAALSDGEEHEIDLDEDLRDAPDVAVPAPSAAPAWHASAPALPEVPPPAAEMPPPILETPSIAAPIAHASRPATPTSLPESFASVPSASPDAHVAATPPLDVHVVGSVARPAASSGAPMTTLEAHVAAAQEAHAGPSITPDAPFDDVFAPSEPERVAASKSPEIRIVPATPSADPYAFAPVENWEAELMGAPGEDDLIASIDTSDAQIDSPIAMTPANAQFDGPTATLEAHVDASPEPYGEATTATQDAPLEAAFAVSEPELVAATESPKLQFVPATASSDAYAFAPIESSQAEAIATPGEPDLVASIDWSDSLIESPTAWTTVDEQLDEATTTLETYAAAPIGMHIEASIPTAEADLVASIVMPEAHVASPDDVTGFERIPAAAIERWVDATPADSHVAAPAPQIVPPIAAKEPAADPAAASAEISLAIADGHEPEEAAAAASYPAVVLPISRSPIRNDQQPPLVSEATLSGLERLLRVASARAASTLYLSSDSRPSVRVDGELQLIDAEPVHTARDVESLLLTLMPERSHEALRTGALTEWICDIDGVGRVRCVSFRDHRGPGGVFRLMPTRSVSVEQLGLPRHVQSLAIEPEGLVLVAGPRSSGKRTLMAAFVDLMNRMRRDHIITIEREINIVHEGGHSFISQREVRGNDDEMLAAARGALREDPDVLVIEDLRTAALMNVALDAAASGHLVVGGFSAHTAAGTIDRIIDLYAPEQRRQVQLALAESMRGVIVQVLLRKIGGGRLPAREVLLNTPAVSSVIAEGKTSQLPMAIEGGRRYGMMPLNDALVGLVQSGSVEAHEAYRQSPDRAGFVAALTRHGLDTSFIERLA